MASHFGDRSRSQSPPGRRHPDPIWKRQMRTMPAEHSKFIWDIMSYISNLQAFLDFAIGCGIPSHIVQKVIEDNDPSNDDISLDDCAAQALTVWWLGFNKPAICKSDRIRQGFVKLHMPGIHTCLIKRHPILDPKPSVPNNQIGPQPGTSGQISRRPAKYLSMEYITLYLKSTEYDLLREVSNLIQTPENAYCISCITNLPDATFVFIRQEHTCFGLPVKEIQGRIAFHVLAIWHILASGVNERASLIKDMFYDPELDEECEDIFDKFPWVTSERDRTGARNKMSNISMGTKILGTGQKSKSSTAVLLGRMGREWIWKNRCQIWLKMLKMITAVQVGGQQSQPLITFGKACLNNMADTTENLGQSIDVTFAVDNENSRNTPPNPHVLLRDVSQEQSQGDKLAALSDKL